MRIKRILLAVTIAATLLITAAFTDQVSGPTSTVIIKTIEKPNGTALQRSILAVYKDGAIVEHLELEELNGRSPDYNLKAVGDLLVKYQADGYEIKSTAGSGASNSITFIHILVKR